MSYVRNKWSLFLHVADFVDVIRTRGRLQSSLQLDQSRVAKEFSVAAACPITLDTHYILSVLL
jgi:hypothetical protein